MKPLVLLAALLVGGCAGGNPIHKALDEAAANQDDAKCRSFGAAPGTQGYFDCRMKLDSDRNARGIANSQSWDAAMAERQRQQDANSAALIQSLQPAPTVTCTSQRTYGIGNPVVTQCR